MPSGRAGLTCRHIFTLMAVVFLVPAGVAAQAGVTMKANVSETVTLSVAPNFTDGDVHASVVSSGSTVRITLSSTDARGSVIRVPLLVRSNSGFKISATVDSNISQLSITDVRASGTLVSPAAISSLSVPRQFDLRGSTENASLWSNLLDDARPVLLASGPRVSLGGTLDSPNNALQITVLIRMNPQPTHASSIHLTFAATAVPLTP